MEMDINRFIKTALLMVFLVIPAMTSTIILVLCLFGIYDFKLTHVETNRALYLESDIFKQEVDNEVGKVRAEYILTFEERCKQFKGK